MALKIVDDLSKQQYIQFDGTDYNGKDVVIFSTTGERRSEADFEKAINQYNVTKGKAPKGFTVMEPGVISTIRSGFEAARQPIQKGVEEFGGATGAALSGPGALLALLGEKAGALPQGAGSEVLETGSRVGRAAGRIAASPLDRPETAAAMVGSGVGSYIGRGTSLLPQMFTAGAGGGLGALLGGAATGSFESTGQVLTETFGTAFLSAATQGATGVLKSALSSGISERAQQQVVSGIMERLKTQYRHIANDPNAVEMLLSTPAELSRLAQLGSKAILGDLDDLAATVTPKIQQVLPRTLSSGSSRVVNGQLRHITELNTKLLDDIGDTKSMVKIYGDINTAVDRIKSTLDTEFKNLTPQVRDNVKQRVDAVLAQYVRSFDQYKPAALLFQSLRDSGAKTGFNVQSFQETLRSKYHALGGFMEDIGRIAGRGAELSEGIDRAIRPGEALMRGTLRLSGLPPILQRILAPIVGLGPQIGTRYAGTVQGQFPGATAAAVGNTSGRVYDEIKSFYEEK